MLRVKIRIGDKEKEVTVRKVPFTVGGSAKSDLFVIGVPAEYAVIDRKGDAYVLKAFGKGITVNGIENVQEAELTPGTEVDFAGKVHLEVIEAPQMEGTSQPTQFLEAEEPPYFKILTGPNAGSVIEIVSSGILGRSPSVEYQVNDPHTSREHLKIHFLGDAVEVENLSATNPTEINKKLLKGRVRLKSGDVLKVGRMTLLYVNPNEKPETELMTSASKVNPVIIGAVGFLVVLLVAITAFLYTNQRRNEAQSNLSLAVSTFATAENETSPEKIRKNYLLVKEYADKALKLNGKLSQAKEYIRKADSLLSAWDKVIQARKLITEKKFNDALAKLDSVAPILGDRPQFTSLYAPLLNRLAVEENLNLARALIQKGDYKNALKALDAALSIDPDNPDILALKSTISELTSSKKRVKVEEIKKVFAEKKKEVKREETPEKVETATTVGVSQTSKKIALSGEEIKLGGGVPTKTDVDVKLPSVSVNLDAPAPKLSLATSQTIDKQQQIIDAYKRGDLRTVKQIATDLLSENPRNITAKRYQQLAELESKAKAYERAGNKKEALKYWKLLLSYDKTNVRAQKAVARLSQ